MVRTTCTRCLALGFGKVCEQGAVLAPLLFPLPPAFPVPRSVRVCALGREAKMQMQACDFLRI